MMVQASYSWWSWFWWLAVPQQKLDTAVTGTGLASAKCLASWGTENTGPQLVGILVSLCLAQILVTSVAAFCLVMNLQAPKSIQLATVLFYTCRTTTHMTYTVLLISSLHHTFLRWRSPGCWHPSFSTHISSDPLAGSMTSRSKFVGFWKITSHMFFSRKLGQKFTNSYGMILQSIKVLKHPHVSSQSYPRSPVFDSCLPLCKHGFDPAHF